MKKQSTLGFVLKLTVTLLLITGITAAALAAVNKVTAPRIAEINAQKIQDAIEEVLEGGGEPLSDFSTEGGVITAVYASDSGYAVEVNPAGFNGAIKMMVGIDKEGKILKIAIVSHTETAGLGAEAAKDNEKGETFRGYFIGQSGEVKLSKEGGVIDALTGATITSQAVVDGVNAALRCVEKLG